MKNLEGEILKKVYNYETKKTFFEIFSRTIILIFIGLVAFIFGSTLLEILVEQRSFDFMTVFKEDFAVVRKFFLDALYVFYLETPKIMFLVFTAGLICFIILVLQVIANFSKIKNRVKSIFKYWRHPSS